MGEDDFDPEEEHLGWGYSDEATFEKLLETLDSKEQPFFSAMFTVTNHHPYELPDSYQSEGKSHGDKYFDALHYTSAQIHQFVEKAKKKDWYDETIIFILADTATNLPSKHHDTNFHKKGEPTKIGINHEEFINVTHRIPLLILGGKITEPFLFDRVSSQIDLAPTIADLIGLEGYTHWIGQSLLSKVDDEWAFVSRPKSYFAIIEDDLFVYADQKDDAFHFTFKGNPNPDARSQAQKFGLALIKSQRWLFQENKIWTESLSPRLGEVN